MLLEELIRIHPLLGNYLAAQIPPLCPERYFLVVILITRLTFTPACLLP